MQRQSIQYTLPENLIRQIADRVWLKSHSLKAVQTFRQDMKLLGRFLTENNITWEECLKRPIDVLDQYVVWQDKEGFAGVTIHRTISFAKRAIKFAGAKVSDEDFKDRVTMPRKMPTMDDKVSRQQIRDIILALKHLGFKVMLMLMKDTQARPGEILGLKLSDFNIAHDPPYFNIPSELAKSNIPRELFFTDETKQLLITYLNKTGRKNGFVFLSSIQDERDEVAVQRRLIGTQKNYQTTFRRLIETYFKDMNQVIRDRQSSGRRYKFHIYSFKKFAFTVMADTLGEIAARAIKGDKEYVMTYYRKSREERADDFRRVTPKLSVFEGHEVKSMKDEAREKIDSMTKDDLKALLEYINKQQ